MQLQHPANLLCAIFCMLVFFIPSQNNFHKILDAFLLLLAVINLLFAFSK